MFPACSSSAVKDLWQKTLEVSAVSDYASSFVRTAIHHLCEDEYLHDDVHGGGAISFKPRLTSLTEKAQQLAAERLRRPQRPHASGVHCPNWIAHGSGAHNR